MSAQLKRRQFITLLSGAAVAWPLAARAQQPDQLRRIGVLMGYSANSKHFCERSRRELFVLCAGGLARSCQPSLA